jgi:NAD(P)-dependent dehydrogenase (short-subunit alcohol dehydrogenase family)
MTEQAASTASTAPVALLTGAAGGIGRATAWGLARAGYRLALTGRGASVEKLAAEISAAGLPAWAHVAELSREDEVKALVQATLKQYGRVDALINNAGTHIYKGKGGIFGIEELSLAQWNEIIAINLTAPFLLSRELLPTMRAQQYGRIVNVISRTARTFVPGVGADYVATKAGLQGFTRTLAGENAKHGITANCVAPGRISTELADRVDDAVMQAALARIPMRRAGQPDEVVAAIVFLASRESSYITGAVLDVNGGGFMP